MNGDTLAERYEPNMSRFEQITRAGYQVSFHWKCENDDAELLTHLIVRHSPLCTRDALYEVGQRPCVYILRCGKMRLFNM